MNTVDMRDAAQAGVIIDAYRHGPVVVQLPTVFAVVAPPTRDGVVGLDRAKQRLPNKTYGSLVGERSSFWDLAQLGLHVATEELTKIEDVFFRVSIGAEDLETAVVRRGTHQGIQLSGAAGALMRALDGAMAPEPSLFGGKMYTSPLGSSWNISGDADGSIVERDRAIHVARAQGIALFVTGPSSADKGSYPIVELDEGAACVRREGPGLKTALDAIEEALTSNERLIEGGSVPTLGRA